MVTKQDVERIGIEHFFREIYFNFGEDWDNLPKNYEIEEQRLLTKYAEVERMLKEKR